MKKTRQTLEKERGVLIMNVRKTKAIYKKAERDLIDFEVEMDRYLNENKPGRQMTISEFSTEKIDCTRKEEGD